MLQQVRWHSAGIPDYLASGKCAWQSRPELENGRGWIIPFFHGRGQADLKKKTMWFIFLQGLPGVFPGRDHLLVLTISKRTRVRPGQILMTMAPVIMCWLWDFHWRRGGAFSSTHHRGVSSSQCRRCLGGCVSLLASTRPWSKQQFFHVDDLPPFLRFLLQMSRHRI